MAKRGPKGPSKYTEEYIEQLADELIEWCSSHTNFIIGKFAEEHGFSQQRMSEMAAKNDKFSEAYERAKQHQQNVLFEGGLTNEFNAQIVKFGLAANHNWREKSETDITSGGEPLKVSVVSYGDEE